MKRTVTAEQYFTPPSLARRCIETLDARFPLQGFDLIVEPSAGEGAFFDLLPPDARVGIDLHPRHDGVAQADFLTWHPGGAHTRTLTIGNPPFGQRAALAVEFIKHACSFSDVVAFILPRSFNKYTFQNRVPLDFHLVESVECEEFVTPEGEQVSVKAVFQIWEKRPEHRTRTQPPDSHPDFEMRHAHLSRLTTGEAARMRRDYDFTIPQVGADFSPRDPATVSRGSHWFIRPTAPDVRRRFELLDFSFLDGMNTAHKSLSKRDIVTAYVAVLAQEAGRT